MVKIIAVSSAQARVQVDLEHGPARSWEK